MAEDTFQLFTSLRYDDTLVGTPKTEFHHAGWNFENSSPWYMLGFHRDRMLRAATHWGWEDGIALINGDAGLQTLKSHMTDAVAAAGETGPLRVKVTLSRLGKLGYEISSVPEKTMENLFPLRLPPPGLSQDGHDVPMTPLKPPLFEVILDRRRTARSEYTHFKTTNRVMYDDARKSAGVDGSAHKEVLIVHEHDGSIMEGSATTPYFWRGGRWVTPPVSATYSTNPKAGSGGQDGTSRRWALERCAGRSLCSKNR